MYMYMYIMCVYTYIYISHQNTLFLSLSLYIYINIQSQMVLSIWLNQPISAHTAHTLQSSSIHRWLSFCQARRVWEGEVHHSDWWPVFKKDMKSPWAVTFFRPGRGGVQRWFFYWMWYGMIWPGVSCRIWDVHVYILYMIIYTHKAEHIVHILYIYTYVYILYT